MLLAALGKKSRMTVQELEKESGMRNILPTLRVLLEREAVFVSEQLKTNYRPKTIIVRFLEIYIQRDRRFTFEF